MEPWPWSLGSLPWSLGSLPWKVGPWEVVSVHSLDGLLPWALLAVDLVVVTGLLAHALGLLAHALGLLAHALGLLAQEPLAAAEDAVKDVDVPFASTAARALVHRWVALPSSMVAGTGAFSSSSSFW